MALTPGAKLGPYEIQSPLGAGGMGEVYRAKDTRLDRTVAIKVLPSHLSSDPELKQRMEREAKAISALQHANICTLHDIGTQDGTDFLVMEYLEGQTLADRLAKGVLPFDQVLKIGTEVAQALEKAHQRGIIHRDLKPANIMLTKAGAKLMDFGLAKPKVSIASPAIGPFTPSTPTMNLASLTSAASPLTQKGSIVGTFQYMAPELLQGAEADARGDLFSFGCVLYEMVTGRRAFEGKSQLSVFTAILEKDPEPISTLRGDVPPALAHVIDGCLNKDPEQRWQSAGDISRELKWISNAAPEAAIASKPRPAKQVLVYSGVAALLLIATIVLAAKLLTRIPAEQWKLQSDSDKHDVVDAESAAIQLSADGSKLAFVAADAHSAIFVRDLRTGKLDQLKGTEGALFPFWSPDGRALGFFAAQKLRAVSLDQGMVQTLCDAPGGRGGTWNTDGQIVFTPNISDPLYVVSDSGGTPKAVTPASTGRSDRVPFFLPDQKHFLYIEQFTGTSNELHASYDILVGSVDGAMPRKVLSGEYDSPQFAEGKLLYGRDRSLFAQDFSLSTFQVSGKPVKIADDVNTYHGRALASFSVSNSGLLAYRTSPVRFTDLVLLDRSGRADVSFPATEKGWSGTFDVARDSSKALFCESDQSGIDNCSTWMLDFGSKAFSKLPLELLHTQAVFTSGLEAVVYVDNTSHLKKYSFTSGATEDFGVQTTDYSSPVDVTPRGDVVLTVQRQQTGTGNDVTWMTLKPLSKMRDIVATPREEYGQKLSPNGKWLPYCFDEGGVTNLSVAAFPAGRPQWQLTTAGGCQATWSADGHELFFVSGNKVYAMPVKDPNNFEPAPPQVLFEIPTNITGGRMMPDGKHFLGFRATGATRGGEINVIVNWRVPQSR